jgi:acetoin utilization deacetylase AcuC-like enzyme
VGDRLAALGLPTVLIQEGGYDLEALGLDVMAVLTAFR